MLKVVTWLQASKATMTSMTLKNPQISQFKKRELSFRG